MAWLDELDAALTKSEKAFAEATKAQGEKGGHVDLGRSAEKAWAGVMFRLRRYIESRADRNDVAKRNEGRMLLKPLLDAIQKQKADAAARATRRAKASGCGSTATGVATGTNGSPAVATPPVE